MKESAKKLLQEVISHWMGKRLYTYESKHVAYCYPNPAKDEEYVLAFKNSIYCFFCDNQLIPIELLTKPFITQTLSDDCLSENPMSDRDALRKILEEFDNDFYKMVESKLEGCVDRLTTSDPVFF